jgi:histidinol-phosphate aminotransferase
LENKESVENTIAEIIDEREKLIKNLSGLEIVTKVFPTDANFVLVKTVDADKIYRHLIDEKIVVRNRNNVEMCEGCLRITIGTPEENERLLKELKNFVISNR